MEYLFFNGFIVVCVYIHSDLYVVVSCADFQCLIFQVFSLTFYEVNRPILDLSIGSLVCMFNRVFSCGGAMAGELMAIELLIRGQF